MHTMVICFDRLPYGLLGCYGNTEASTPGFDRLAAQSVTFDNGFAADVREDGCDAISRSIVMLADRGVKIRVIAAGETALLRQLRSQSTDLEVEEVDLTSSKTSDFDKITQAISPPAETSGQQPMLTLLSLPGLPNDVDDPQSHAVASAVAAADDVIGRIVDALADAHEDEPLVIVTAALGGPFEETSASVPYDSLREQTIHVPLIVRATPVPVFGMRCASLVTTADVAATLTESCGRSLESGDGRNLMAEVRGEETSGRDAIVLRGLRQVRGLRTARWQLITEFASDDEANDVSAAAESAVLFMKPDDLWNQLDVAKQTPDVVETLVRRLFEAEETASSAR